MKAMEEGDHTRERGERRARATTAGSKGKEGEARGEAGKKGRRSGAGLTGRLKFLAKTFQHRVQNLIFSTS